MIFWKSNQIANGTLNFGSGNGNWLRPSNHERKLLIGPEHTFHWLQWRTSCSKLRKSEAGGGSALEGTPAVVLISLITFPHPSPKLTTPTRTCLPSTSTVKGPPLSPWGAKSIVFHVSFCNPHITVKMVGHQNLGMMQEMGKLAKTSHKSFSCICWCLSCSSFLCDLSCLSYLYILWEISPDKSLYW